MLSIVEIIGNKKTPCRTYIRGVPTKKKKIMVRRGLLSVMSGVII